MMNVLMVDDDTELCEMVTEYLKLEGFQVTAVHDGQSGIKAAQSGAYAMVLLDVMLPRTSGLEVLRAIRSSANDRADIPVLMLTARGDARDRVLGLEIGADDYLPKPFDERELVARVRAILRRAGQSTLASKESSGTPPVLRVDDVEVNIGARRAQCDGATLQLTSVEFDLLVMLLRKAGKVVERDEIAQQVLGRTLMHFDRSIDTHISRLRRKLGPRRDGGER